MSKTISIQLKAAFLLIIFSMNMLVGFSCAVGVDMGFNTAHHHEGEATELHVHADGKKHHHEKSFQDEYRELMLMSGMELDERYAWG